MEKEYTKEGKLAIVCGILSVTLLVIFHLHLFISYSFIVLPMLLLAIIAIGFGIYARRKLDARLGTWGIILGVSTFILQILLNYYGYLSGAGKIFYY